MARYIDADKYRKEWMKFKTFEPMLCLDLIPTEDVAPVVHAKWTERKIVGDILKGDRKLLVCSHCNLGIANVVLGFANYCPNCGARMDGE